MSAEPNVFIPDEGAKNDLDNWVAGDLGSCAVRLYDNNHVFGVTDTVSDYNESSFVGYAPAMSPAWGPPFINGDGKAETDSPGLTWTFTSGSGTAVVYGIYITDSAGTKLLAVIPLLSPVTLSPAQPSLTYVVQITAVSELT
jgi:hypothetical protein